MKKKCNSRDASVFLAGSLNFLDSEGSIEDVVDTGDAVDSRELDFGNNNDQSEELEDFAQEKFLLQQEMKSW
jgi:hypothetical protein